MSLSRALPFYLPDLQYHGTNFIIAIAIDNIDANPIGPLCALYWHNLLVAFAIANTVKHFLYVSKRFHGTKLGAFIHDIIKGPRQKYPCVGIHWHGHSCNSSKGNTI